jgi:hypothetical protein
MEVVAMAQKIQVSLVDDLDGGVADETIVFGIDGRAYEIDLSTKNAAALRKSLDKYLPKARKVVPAKGAPQITKGPRVRHDSDAGAIREWAAAHDMPVSERGRISSEVRAAYVAATKG